MGSIIKICRRTDLSDAERQALDAAIMEIFGEAVHSLKWAEREWHITLRVDGELVSHVDLVKRASLVGGQPVMLGGVGDVITLPQWRKRGYSYQTLRAAQEFMRDELKVPFGLLVTGDDMLDFYGRLGWQVVSDTLWFDQPTGRRSMPPVPGKVMILRLGDTQWPGGEIDIQGLPW